ncbi:hypothetical protein [Nonomuraea sp. SYSU D8015]|uniref:hypothetical protein n=1 Tax=Nonomuraea sp. SYSU D8015 TaxID=2593644 RepID=UPI001CB6D6CB|nr:hypothetical protein [Nonomuraea sp. SYSU D8015]
MFSHSEALPGGRGGHAPPYRTRAVRVTNAEVAWTVAGYGRRHGLREEAISFSHRLARHCPDTELKRQLARVRHLEGRQQKAVNWLLPRTASVLESTIAYETGRRGPDRLGGPHGATIDLHALTITAAEQQTMNFYMNVGPCRRSPSRGSYHSFLETESDPKVKSSWELHLNMELEHPRPAAELFKRFDGRDPDQVLAPALPPPVTFQPNKAYVRELIATRIDQTTHYRLQTEGPTRPASSRAADGG